MSEFKCEVVRVHLEPHPNGDQIEIARVGDFQSIVKKGQFAEGDLAVYLPEQAIIPEWMLREIGMYDEERQKGDLAGSLGNRVKAIKLRGVVSQGLMYPAKYGAIYAPDGEHTQKGCLVEEGSDVAEFMGIIKYEPAIPSHMRGRIVGVDLAATHNYDFNNLKKTPSLFEDGEEVVITEKIHGTFIQVGVVPSSMANDKYYGGRVIVSSKGLGAKGFVLDHNDEGNLYAQAAHKHGLLEFALCMLGDIADEAGKPVFLMGEVFGLTNGGADVQAAFKYTGERLDFRAFDICVGNRGNEEYFTFPDFVDICDECGIPRVPVLYVGPYSKEVVLSHTDGSTTLHPVVGTGKIQIREGVVVKSYFEVKDRRYGRKIAKSVSNDYLLRKGEVTEFA